MANIHMKESKKIIKIKKIENKPEYEYPLKSPNATLYRKNGRNPIQVYALWDGGGALEIYRTPDDGGSSIATIDITKDEYTIWYECKKAKPSVKDYKLKITRNIQDVHNPDKIIFFAGEIFKGFELVYSGSTGNTGRAL